LVKPPLSSVTRVAATWLVRSQYRVRLSFFRKFEPVTVIALVIRPAVGCKPIVASEGRGAYTIAGFPVVGLELVALTVKVYVTLSARPEAVYVVVELSTRLLTPPGLTVML
jgi:hypothetical protein